MTGEGVRLVVVREPGSAEMLEVRDDHGRVLARISRTQYKRGLDLFDELAYFAGLKGRLKVYSRPAS